MATATRRFRHILRTALWLTLTFSVESAFAAGSAGAIHGAVTGPDGKPMAGVAVQLRNDITGFKAEARTAADGTFQFFGVPFNPYELHVEAQGFKSVHQAVDIRTSIPKEINVALELQPVSENVQVTVAEPTAAELETDTSMSHIDIDKSYIQRVPAAVSSRAMEEHHHFDAGLRQGRERPLPLPGRAQPERVRDRRPDDLRPDRRHLLQLDRPGHRPVDRGHLRQRAGRVRREDRQRRQHGDEVGARNARPQRRRLRRLLALRHLRSRGIRRDRQPRHSGSSDPSTASGSDYFTDPVNPDNLNNHGDTQRAFLRFDWRPRHLSSQLPAVRAARPHRPRRHRTRTRRPPTARTRRSRPRTRTTTWAGRPSCPRARRSM